MELSQYFTGLVALVCAIHLAGVIGRPFSTLSALSALDDTTRHHQPRGDWYLFFHCADLTGSNSTKAVSTSRKPVQENQEASDIRQKIRPSRASLRC
jgi:hypothetical protein